MSTHKWICLSSNRIKAQTKSILFRCAIRRSHIDVRYDFSSARRSDCLPSVFRAVRSSLISQDRSDRVLIHEDDQGCCCSCVCVDRILLVVVRPCSKGKTLDVVSETERDESLSDLLFPRRLRAALAETRSILIATRIFVQVVHRLRVCEQLEREDALLTRRPIGEHASGQYT